MLWMQNLLLMLFNLIPVPPLDGAAMLSGILPKTLREKWQIAMHDSRVAGVWDLGRLAGIRAAVETSPKRCL